MIKYLFLLFSTFSIAMVNLFDLQNVVITQNIPDYLVAGKVYDVDFVIKKDDIAGFAKFQMEVPDGINVVSVETRNSSFTFKSNVVKNIWMNVPVQSEIILSYKFEVSNNFQGNGSVKARFVFIKDNERFTVEMPVKEVTVGDGSGIASVAGASNSGFSPDKIKINRTIKAMGNNQFDVNILIEKDGMEGFAKVQDLLPEGFEARPMRTSKSVFSVVDNKVKFIWFNIPPDETIEISYILVSDNPVTEGSVLMGSFNYLFNDEAQQVDFPEENLIAYVDESDRALAATKDSENSKTTKPEPNPDVAVATTAIVGSQQNKTEEVQKEATVKESKPADPAPIEKEIIAREVVKDENIKSEEKVAAVQKTKVEDPVVPKTGIFYRVQIAAGKKNVNVAYIKKKHHFNHQIFLENHESWYKYTTGNFPQYLNARNRREEIRQKYKFKGPFVTAYNAGQRITVQEALLITKQKWVK